MRLNLTFRILVSAVALSCIGAIPHQAGPTSWEKPVAPGLVFREEVDFENHHSVFAYRLSLHSSAVRAAVALASGMSYTSSTATGRAPVAKIVERENALGGVNGDFFSMVSGPSGDPLGIAVREGRLLSTPNKRVAFGWGPADCRFSVASLTASLDTEQGSIKIDGVNRKCPDNQITLDTPDAGLALAESPSVQVKLRLNDPVWSPSTVLRGKVVSVSTDPLTGPIGPNEAVLTARGSKTALLDALHPNVDCTIKLRTTGFDWEKIDSVIGGGPWLVKGGSIAVDGAQEGFNSEFVDSKHPRTAVGRTSEDDIWIVAVDGRQETGDGMSLDELAHLMQRLGCVDAMNLDGGGSTTMNVLGVTVNRPSDGSERPVADALILLGPRLPVSSQRTHISLPTTLGTGTTALARVIEGDLAAPDLEVIWGATGACAVDGGGQIQALHPGPGTITAFCHGHLLTAKITVTN